MAPARSFLMTFSHIAAFAVTCVRSAVSSTTPDAVAAVLARAL